MPRTPAQALPFVPRGLSREQAAAYVGIGATLFDRAVADGKMPAPLRLYGRVVWDRARLAPRSAPSIPGGT